LLSRLTNSGLVAIIDSISNNYVLILIIVIACISEGTGANVAGTYLGDAGIAGIYLGHASM